MESWCGHDGLAAECAQDPEDRCGPVTRVEHVESPVRPFVCCYGSFGAGICDSDLGGPHQPRYFVSCAQGLVATSQFVTDVAWCSRTFGCGDHELEKD